jgi:hypothetical protein
MPPRPAEARWTAQNLTHRLGKATVARLVRDYEAGDGCTTLARRYGLSENGVLAEVKRSGVELRPPGKLTEVDVAEMARLRAAGWTYRAIGQRFGVSRTAATARLRRT